MSDYYYLEGKKAVKCSFQEWIDSKDLSEPVAKTAFKPTDESKESVVISTVFLGLDHSFMSGPPQIFETMIFGGEHKNYCERYSTWNEAEDGHKKAVAMLNTQALLEK